jgi:hypothetical protein
MHSSNDGDTGGNGSDGDDEVDAREQSRITKQNSAAIRTLVEKMEEISTFMGSLARDSAERNAEAKIEAQTVYDQDDFIQGDLNITNNGTSQVVDRGKKDVGRISGADPPLNVLKYLQAIKFLFGPVTGAADLDGFLANLVGASEDFCYPPEVFHTSKHTGCLHNETYGKQNKGRSANMGECKPQFYPGQVRGLDRQGVARAQVKPQEVLLPGGGSHTQACC